MAWAASWTASRVRPLRKANGVSVRRATRSECLMKYGVATVMAKITVRVGAAFALTSVFDIAHWSHALDAAGRACPAAAPILAARWGVGVDYLYAEQYSGLAVTSLALGPFLQGGVTATRWWAGSCGRVCRWASGWLATLS